MCFEVTNKRSLMYLQFIKQILFHYPRNKITIYHVLTHTAYMRRENQVKILNLKF